jgi:hypothetical protein
MLSGCLAINVADKGRDPTTLLNWQDVYARSANAGSQEREKALLEWRMLVVEPSEPIAMEITAAFDEVAMARRALTERTPFPQSIDRSQPFFHVRRDMENLRPKLIVISIDAPYSVTFADKTVIISRRFVDGLIGGTTSVNHWSLRAVAAHELAHFYDGHPMFNWLVTSGKNQIGPRRVAALLSSITEILPVTVDYQYDPGEIYPNLSLEPSVFEFLADYWAFYTLKEMNAPSGSVSSMLVAVRDADGSDTTASAQLINARAMCMTLLDGQSGFDPEVKIRPAYVDAFTDKSIMDAVLGSKSLFRRLLITGQDAATRDQIASEIDNYISASSDDAYWACAGTFIWFAQFEAERGKRLRDLFSIRDASTFRSVFAELARDGGDGNLVLSSIRNMDGIPLTEARLAFRHIASNPAIP